MSILRAQLYRLFNVTLSCIICITIFSLPSHAAVGDLIIDSHIILRENRESTTLLKEGYALSLDKIRPSSAYPEKSVVFLTLYKNGKEVQKITVKDDDIFFYNTTIDGTEYTIIQAEVIVLFGLGGPNFIKMEPFLQYSDGTVEEPFIADMIFQVPGIMAPEEEWNRTFGGPHHEEKSQFLLHAPEGYTIAGRRISYPRDYSQDTVWLIHTDTGGSEQWNRILEDVTSYGYSIDQTRDGGYIFLGEDMYSETLDHKDAYLIKLDENGEQQWKRTIEDLNPQYSIQQTADSGYIIAAIRRTMMESNIVTRLIKTDEQGSEQWSRNLAGFTFFPHCMVRQTRDGGYILAGDILPENVMLLKTDADGNEQWHLTLTGDHLNSILQTREEDYIFAGRTGGDAWLVRVDAQGCEQWNRTFGLGGFDFADSVLQTSDGGFILAGQIDSAKDPDLKDQILYSNPDAWLIKTDFHGNLEWSRIFGGLREEGASSILQTAEGGYIITGSTDSSGSNDIWMIKITGTGNTTSLISDMNETGITSPISDVNETGIPSKTTPGFEFAGVLISTALLFFLQRKFIWLVKKG